VIWHHNIRGAVWVRVVPDTFISAHKARDVVRGVRASGLDDLHVTGGALPYLSRPIDLDRTRVRYATDERLERELAFLLKRGVAPVPGVVLRSIEAVDDRRGRGRREREEKRQQRDVELCAERKIA
jgi:hypothetical protein